MRAVRHEDADPLTGREREVVGLVAAGLNNRELARRLCISVYTVKHHSRVALALYGIRHGLVAPMAGGDRPIA